MRPAVAQDVVIAAPDRDVVGALIVPNLPACAALCPELPKDTPARALLQDARVRARFQVLLDDLARESTGSTTFVARAILLDEPPSIDAREITDKGSLNQKMMLQNRSALVDELYAETSSARVLRAAAEGPRTLRTDQGPGTTDRGLT